MKTKVFKSILPLFAILLAISLSFATTANSTLNEPGYYDHPILGAQPVPGGVDCPQSGTITCKYGTYDVFADQSLTIQLYEKQ